MQQFFKAVQFYWHTLCTDNRGCQQIKECAFNVRRPTKMLKRITLKYCIDRPATPLTATKTP